MIDQSLLISKRKILWGWACQILGRDKWKIRDKTRKMINFPGLWKEISTICPWMVRTTPILPFWPQIPYLISKLSQKTQKTMFLNKFWNIPQFDSLPPPISEINPKFDYATLCALNRSLVSQNFIFKSYLYQKLSRRKLWGVGSTLLSLESGRVKVRPEGTRDRNNEASLGFLKNGIMGCLFKEIKIIWNLFSTRALWASNLGV